MPTTVYRYYDLSGDLLYIGVTQNAVTRALQHYRDQEWWDEVASISFEKYPTRAEGEAAEVEAIVAERPRYNIQHNDDGSWQLTSDGDRVVAIPVDRVIAADHDDLTELIDVARSIATAEMMPAAFGGTAKGLAERLSRLKAVVQRESLGGTVTSCEVDTLAAWHQAGHPAGTLFEARGTPV